MCVCVSWLNLMHYSKPWNIDRLAVISLAPRLQKTPLKSWPPMEEILSKLLKCTLLSQLSLLSLLSCKNPITELLAEQKSFNTLLTWQIPWWSMMHTAARLISTHSISGASKDIKRPGFAFEQKCRRASQTSYSLRNTLIDSLDGAGKDYLWTWKLEMIGDVWLNLKTKVKGLANTVTCMLLHVECSTEISAGSPLTLAKSQLWAILSPYWFTFVDKLAQS